MLVHTAFRKEERRLLAGCALRRHICRYSVGALGLRWVTEEKYMMAIVAEVLERTANIARFLSASATECVRSLPRREVTPGDSRHQQCARLRVPLVRARLQPG